MIVKETRTNKVSTSLNDKEQDEFLKWMKAHGFHHQSQALRAMINYATENDITLITKN